VLGYIVHEYLLEEADGAGLQIVDSVLGVNPLKNPGHFILVDSSDLLTLEFKNLAAFNLFPEIINRVFLES
jgi:hypothetical protein